MALLLVPLEAKAVGNGGPEVNHIPLAMPGIHADLSPVTSLRHRRFKAFKNASGSAFISRRPIRTFCYKLSGHRVLQPRFQKIIIRYARIKCTHRWHHQIPDRETALNDLTLAWPNPNPKYTMYIPNVFMIDGGIESWKVPIMMLSVDPKQPVFTPVG